MAMRRQVRLRKEYLYRKSLEGKERDGYEKKKRIRDALAEGKALPTELRDEEAALRHEIGLEDEATAQQRSHVDDEYAAAGRRDPKVCVTTARDPSSRLKQFAKELKLVFPNAQRVNRGSHQVKELLEACRANDFTDIVMVQETRGEPDGLVVCHLPLGPTAYFGLSGCVLRHDIPDRGTVSEAYPHLIVEGFNTPLGKRFSDVLRYLFPVPREGSKRVMTFANHADTISFRHHTFEKGAGAGGGGSAEGSGGGSGKRGVALSEVGPRFEMTPFRLRLGTLEQAEAEDEWALRPYMNSAKRRRNL